MKEPLGKPHGRFITSFFFFFFKSSSMSLMTLFFFKIAWIILESLLFNVNFSISLSISIKMTFWHFNRGNIEYVDQFEEN